MKILSVFLVSVALTSAELYNINDVRLPINDLGDYSWYNFKSSIQNKAQMTNFDGTIRTGYPYLDNNSKTKFMDYISYPEDYKLYGIVLPPTVVPVTDTPEVKAARKAHQEAYNYLKTIRSGLKHSKHENKQVRTGTPVYRQLESTTTEPLKNYYKTIEVLKKPLSSTESFKAPEYRHRFKNNFSTAPSMDKRKNYKFTAKKSSGDPRVFPTLTPEEHLRALKKVIAEQLRSYVNRPSEIYEENISNGIEDRTNYKTQTSPVVDRQKHFRNSIQDQNELEVERNRKIAVLAATRALMKILKESN